MIFIRNTPNAKEVEIKNANVKSITKVLPNKIKEKATESIIDFHKKYYSSHIELGRIISLKTGKQIGIDFSGFDYKVYIHLHDINEKVITVHNHTKNSMRMFSKADILEMIKEYYENVIIVVTEKEIWALSKTENYRCTLSKEILKIDKDLDNIINNVSEKAHDKYFKLKKEGILTEEKIVEVVNENANNNLSKRYLDYFENNPQYDLQMIKIKIK